MGADMIVCGASSNDERFLADFFSEPSEWALTAEKPSSIGSFKLSDIVLVPMVRDKERKVPCEEAVKRARDESAGELLGIRALSAIIRHGRLPRNWFKRRRYRAEGFHIPNRIFFIGETVRSLTDTPTYLCLAKRDKLPFADAYCGHFPLSCSDYYAVIPDRS